MEYKLFLFICVSVTLIGVNVIGADNTNASTDQKETSKNSTTPTTSTSTPHPTINTVESKLCKKCICDVESKLLDCTNQSISSWFDDNEYKILQYGDVLFDTIRLDHNNLQKIPAIKQIPVKNLYLRFNKIEAIANKAFYSLGNLEILDLAHNELTSKALIPEVFEGPFSPSEYEPLQLKELDLSYNKLHTLDSDIFEHFPKLETLILCGNIFQAIDPASEQAISGIMNLRSLDLSYMELDDLPDHLLHSPRDLKTLILSGNLFDEIPEALTYAINLENLNLDENPIESLIGENIFPKLPRLQIISMSYLPDIVEIGKEAFGKLGNLTKLFMSNNPKLSIIHPDAFVSSNKNGLKNYPPITELYLYKNNLTVLEKELFERWDKIMEIDLRFNPWQCECKNRWMMYSLLGQIFENSPFLLNNTKCATPSEWHNRLILDFVKEAEKLHCTIDGLPITGVSFFHIFLITLVIFVIICGVVFIHKRGYFRSFTSRFRSNNDTNRTLYNKANFRDDDYYI